MPAMAPPLRDEEGEDGEMDEVEVDDGRTDVPEGVAVVEVLRLLGRLEEDCMTCANVNLPFPNLVPTKEKRYTYLKILHFTVHLCSVGAIRLSTALCQQFPFLHQHPQTRLWAYLSF